ncbi:hypothetical protein [Agromyces sp. ZXT2-6]|uniref:hypothetical protein n=1 Tax=Agromyces sp. ZXT2-6 TaxID=3461153 RepID=UPI004054C4E5
MTPVSTQAAEGALSRLVGLLELNEVAPSAMLVSNVTTIVEVYVDHVLDFLIDQDPATQYAFGAALVSAHRREMHDSWPHRHDWLAKGFGLAIGATPEGNRLLSLVDLRNALVHGNGVLTERQTLDWRSLAKIRSMEQVVKCRTNGRRVFVDETTVTTSVQIGRNYILTLDALLTASGRIDVRDL